MWPYTMYCTNFSTTMSSNLACMFHTHLQIMESSIGISLSPTVIGQCRGGGGKESKIQEGRKHGRKLEVGEVMEGEECKEGVRE